MSEEYVLLASAASRKALAMAKSLKEVLGVSVAGVFHTRHPYLYSRAFAERILHPSTRGSSDWPAAVLEAALSLGCFAVIPVDFLDVFALSACSRSFEKRGVLLVAPPFSSVVLASDKARLPEISQGIAPTPRQIVASGGLEGLDALEPPLVVKDLGDASRPTYHLSRESAAEEARRRGRCLVQEFVPGVGRGYYAVAVDGEPLLEFTHERLVEYEPAGGASLAAMGPVKDPRLYAIGRAVLERLRWTGQLMVETRLDLETGAYYLVELNPKFWGSLDLPVSLGYHFPAVLLEAFVRGAESARELAARLRVREGGFSWVLDGFRYLVKVPAALGRLARLGVRREYRSDVDLLDPARVAAQLARALSRLSAERERWVSRLEAARGNLRHWAAMLHSALARQERALLLDLDGVVVDLKVDWRAAYGALVREGYMHKWEKLAEAFERLWRSDKTRYAEASRIVERFELEAVDRSEVLLSSEDFELLSKHYRVYIVTKQPASVATRVLEHIECSRYVKGVVGRDSGFGPRKLHMFEHLTSKLGGGGLVLLDDRLSNLVEALRSGVVPLCVTRDPYRAAGCLELGIPPATPREAARALASLAMQLDKARASAHSGTRA
uniref:ATP-grasp domain-containing protein n=1 Tax=Thermofilum pendens TaxID=2269 RepID=A0A7J3X787_THEPE